ncbi:MAG: flagellin, partial [Bacillota bacterium]|nr:flagellin [Bacillota bacterium]
MRINNNLMAMNTHRQLTLNTTGGAKSIEKLSSGYRINRAGDDAAGLAISEKMRGQIRGLTQASRNAQDDISLIQTTEGALNETHAIIQRMREMAVQSANDTNTDADRQSLQNEMNQLAQEVTRISNSTEFNTRKLLNGNLDAANAGATGDLTFHIGANTEQNMRFSVRAMDAASLGLADTELSGKMVANNGDVTEVVFAGEADLGTSAKVDGMRLTLTAAQKTASTAAVGVLNGVTVTASGDNAAAFNGYTLIVDSSATNQSASMTLDHSRKAITIRTKGTDAFAIDGTNTTVIGNA